jgi:uncharacterized protein YjbI with pentapeptide repeats
LINAAIIEKDPPVRSAILAVFDNLGQTKLSSDALNQGLLTARDRNRTLLNALVNPFVKEQAEQNKRLVDSAYTEVPIGNPSAEDKAPLEASASIIAALIRNGAKVDDLSGIYCVECKLSSFEKPAKLSGVNFDRAFLRRADFSGADLKSSSFNNADLILANFTSANLHAANLSEDLPVESWTVSKIVYSGELAGTYGANFACSDLSSADLGGRITFGLIFGDQVYGGNMLDEFYQADLKDTRMRGIRFLVALPEEAVPATTPGAVQPLPPNLSPTSSTLSTRIGDAVTYYGKAKYVVWEDRFDTPNMGIRPMDGPYRRDWHIALSSLMAAKDLADAELPEPLKNFLLQNAGSLTKPYRSFDCKGGKSADVSDLFSAADKGPKNMVP